MRILLTISVLSSILIGCGTGVKPQDANHHVDNSFVLTNINVVDVVQQKVLSRKNIIVIDGRINAIINPNRHDTYSGLTHIDGKGGFITPGLIDMHVHMYETAAYQLTLSHGVTHVRVMNGIPAHLNWREQVNAGHLIGSSSTVSSPIISAYDDAYLHHSVHTAEQAKQAVTQYIEQGYDLIKAYGNLSKETLTAIIAQGRQLNMPIAKHGPHGSGDMVTGSLSGLQSLEHVEDIYQGPLNYQFSPELLPEVVAELKATGVPVTPTLNIYAQLTQLSQEKAPYLAKTNPEYTSDIIALETSNNQVERWLTASENMAKHNQKVLDFLIFITQKLHQSGIPLLVGSDSGVLLSPHGLATHKEIQLLLQAGLSPFEVLAAATINPARALKLEHNIGHIRVSLQADFIYTQSSPIDDLSLLKEPSAVIKNGHWYSQQTLKKMREQAIASRSLWQELKVLVEAL
ncbi:amidohydrolase family protein [Shewanella colwelliana]|uniref:amidohydrolase family protein n=1 Tax=Shewanella colwelliana TaxID=23 RepID=UPI003D04A26A